jgi:type I restriction enzyme S subunit
LLLPSVAEQRRIVDLIHHVDQPHDRAHVVAQRARRLGDAVRDEWFTERSTLARPLRSVVEVTNGRLRNPRNASGPHMTRYVRSANVQDGRLDLDEPMHMNFTPAEQKRYALRPGDVLVTEGSGSRASIGASCQWHGQIPGVVCFQNHLLRLRPLPGCGLPPSLIYQWALWSHRTGRFAEIATGTNILSLGVERVAAMSIPVDQPAEVLALVSTMEAIQGEEHAATALAASTAGLRSAVLSALLSGDDQLTPSYDRFLDGAA